MIIKLYLLLMFRLMPDYAREVAWVVEKGITNGTSATTFSPDETCTRAQIMAFLYRDRTAYY